MGVPVVGGRTVGVGWRRRWRRVLEQFEVGIARLQHYLTGSGSVVPADHSVDERPVGPRGFHDRREPDDIGVKRCESIEVGRRDGHVVDAPNHVNCRIMSIGFLALARLAERLLG